MAICAAPFACTSTSEDDADELMAAGGIDGEGQESSLSYDDNDNCKNAAPCEKLENFEDNEHAAGGMAESQSGAGGSNDSSGESTTFESTSLMDSNSAPRTTKESRQAIYLHGRAPRHL